MNLPEQNDKKVSCVVRGAELLLKKNQDRTEIGKRIRTHLIRQMWHGESVLALIRDGEDYSKTLPRWN